MARWKLNVAHYIHVPGTFYEVRELSEETGVLGRTTIKVPCFLDAGAIVTDGKGHKEPRDIQFEGTPTPDMTPLDEEAEKINQKFIDSGAWTKPTEGEVYGENLIKNFMEQMARLQASQAQTGPTKEFAELQKQVAELTRQNAELMARIKPVASAKGA